ncbi:hypothetical protein ES705_06762 [subsurface metagenome]
MKHFIAKHQQSVIGVLSGWDRIVFRGTYRNATVLHLPMERRLRCIELPVLTVFGKFRPFRSVLAVFRNGRTLCQDHEQYLFDPVHQAT